MSACELCLLRALVPIWGTCLSHSASNSSWMFHWEGSSHGMISHLHFQKSEMFPTNVLIIVYQPTFKLPYLDYNKQYMQEQEHKSYISFSTLLQCRLWCRWLCDFKSACHDQLALINVDVMENPPHVPARRQKYWHSHLYTRYQALSSGHWGWVAQRLRFSKSHSRSCQNLICLI